MGILTSMAELSPLQSYANGDDYWYTPRSASTPTLAGTNMDSETARTIPAVFACIRVIAETVSTLPLDMYRRNADGSKEKYQDHPLFDTLHHQANPYQTAVEFRELMTAIAVMRGAAFALIDQPDPGREQYDLIPLHPDMMKVRHYGKYGEVRRYFYGTPEVEIPAGDVFHLRGFDGVGIARVARESMALTKATEEYGARFFGQGQRPVGFLSVPQNEKRMPMKDETFGRIRTQLKELYGGMNNHHQIAVLEDGVTWQAMGLTAEDSQFLETRKFQVEEIARWFRVPPHKIGHLEKATYSNIEFQGLEFLTDCIRPWLVRWEQTIRRDLITQPRYYFAEHNVDAILRGDLATRYEAYGLAIDKGIMSPNDARAKENMNDRKDKWGDAYVRNLNQITTIDPEPVAAPPTAPALPGTKGTRPPAAEAPVIRAAALRLAERERHGLASLAPTADVDAWGVTFYEKHATIIAEALALPLEKAKSFCDAQRNRLALHGRDKMAGWTGAIADELQLITHKHHGSTT